MDVTTIMSMNGLRGDLEPDVRDGWISLRNSHTVFTCDL